MKILRPQKVRAETGLGDKLNASFFTFGRQHVLVAFKREVTQACGALHELSGLQTELLGQFGGGQLLADDFNLSALV